MTAPTEGCGRLVGPEEVERLAEHLYKVRLRSGARWNAPETNREIWREIAQVAVALGADPRRLP